MVNKSVLVNKVQELLLEKEIKLSKKVIGSILEVLPASIVAILATNESVNIQGLCSFAPKEVEEREAINPKTQEKITVAPTRLVKITKSKAFADKVKATYIK